MNKTSYDFNVTSENADEFAVVPREQLVLIAQSVNMLSNHVSMINNLLDANGITSYSFDKSVKTIADMGVLIKAND